MGLFFTSNLSTVLVSQIPAGDRISAIELATQAGQISQFEIFRIGNDSDSDVTVTVYTSDPHIEMAPTSARGFAQSLITTIRAGAVGDSIFVRVSAELDAPEGDRPSTIIVDPGDPYTAAILSVNYFVAEADQGSTSESKFVRYAGKDTIQVLAQIEDQGEALVLVRYEPLPKPAEPVGCVSLQQLRNQRIEEWCNPRNGQVGYRATTYETKGFVGDRNMMQNLAYGEQLSLSFGDVEQIILPADFDGLQLAPTLQFFGRLTPFRNGYQKTQWTLRRHDAEYSLINIREQKYFKGQLLFYMADLQKIHWQAAASAEGFLPWNQIYDSTGKVIDYVAGYSFDSVSEDPYDPYCGNQRAVVQRAHLIVTYSDGSTLRIPADQDVTVFGGGKRVGEAEVYAYRQPTNMSTPDIYSIAGLSFAFLTSVVNAPSATNMVRLQLEVEVTYALGLPEVDIFPLQGLNLTLATADEISDATGPDAYITTSISELGIHLIELGLAGRCDLQRLMATGENRLSIAMKLAQAGVNIIGAIEGEAACQLREALSHV